MSSATTPASSCSSGHSAGSPALAEEGTELPVETLTHLTLQDGRSCLYIAAEKGHLDVVKHLAETGGEKLLMRTDKDGRSCLHGAAWFGHLDVVRYLVEKGGRELLMLTDNNGASCLLLAAQQGHLEVVKHLTVKGGGQQAMPSGQAGGMRITVKTITGKRFDLDVQPTDTTEVLKGIINDREGIPEHLQRLIVSGKQLEDGRTLAEHGIGEGSTVHCIVRI